MASDENLRRNPLLPTLSVYLGHVRPQDTYWYLSATPELLTAAATKFQRESRKMNEASLVLDRE
uniref:Integrase n=1 Tax=Bacterium symbiont subsp. Theonella swinhoei (strain pTSMAC1) TaxID=1221190 RepID=J9ZW20_BACS1|nr:integrase [bacterium symbiont of Theonella swinhoei pTSMAC1]